MAAIDVSNLIDNQIKEAGGWRGDVMSKLRKLINDADPDIVEEWKWDTGVFTNNGMVCAIGVFKDHVKLNFFKGAFLKDPDTLFNSGLDSKSQRSINFSEKDAIKSTAVKSLIKEAVAANQKVKK